MVEEQIEGAGLLKRFTSMRLMVIAVFLALIAYSNSLEGPFIWDDYPDILQNPAIRNFDFKVLTTALNREEGAFAIKTPLYFRPLQLFTYMVDYRIWGLNPFGYHVSNVLLHAVVTALVYVLMALLFRNILVPFLGAAFFAIHPVFSSTVAYISGRADILALLFLLSTLILFYKAAEGRSVKLLAYISSLFVFLLALSAKEVALCGIFPIILLAGAVFPKQAGRKPFLLILPYLILIAGFFLIKPPALSGWQKAYEMYQNPVFDLLTVLKGICLYVFLAFVPVQLRMGRTMTAVSSFSDPWLYISAMILVLAVLLFRYGSLKNMNFLFGMSLFFIPLCSLLLFNNFFGRRADEVLLPEHNLYFAYPGLLIAFFSYFTRVKIPARFYTYLLTLTFSLVGSAIALTWAANNHWKDEAAFYERTIRLNKGSLFNYLPYANLAAVYEKQSDMDKAERSFIQAVKVAGNNPYFYNLLAAFYIRRNDPAKAMEVLAISKGLDPYFPQTSFLLGASCLLQGNVGEAKAYLEQLLKFKQADAALIESLRNAIEKTK